MAYVIEQGVALPARGVEQSLQATFRAMKVGESVFVPNRRPADLGTRISAARPAKFSCRSVEGGVRVWRVA